MKATTIENKFPLLSVEHDCIVSKDADVTVAFRVSLPELFTVSSPEYEAIHSAWAKAVKVLPDYSVVQKQDWFVREIYQPKTDDGDMSFLSRSYERHFNERPYLNHECFLYLTKTSKERMRMQSNFSSLCRGNIIPKEVNKDSTVRFLEAVGQFERIINDSSFISLTRLTTDEIIGPLENAGLIEKYFAFFVMCRTAGLSALPVLSACGFLYGTWASFVSLRSSTKPWRSLQQCIAAIPAGVVRQLQ